MPNLIAKLARNFGFVKQTGLDINEYKSATENEITDIDSDGNVLTTSDLIASINKELDRRKAERKPFEAKWTLNSNFLSGNQFCEINPASFRIEQYEAPYPWMEHNSYNRILPLSDTRIANLSTISFSMAIKPRTDEFSDVEKASVSTKLLRYVQETTKFKEKQIQALTWSECTGTAFWTCWWNADAGEDYGNGLHSGDIEYGLLSPYEVYPESVYKQTIEDQRSIIVEQIVSVEDVFDIWGLEVKGEDISTFAIMPVSGGGGLGYTTTCFANQQQTMHDACSVITYYERAGKRYPQGRMAIIINNTLVYYGTLPYSRIPIVIQKCKDIPGMFFGSSWIENEIPLQRAYNGVKNKIHDYIKTLAANTILAEEGSIDDDFFQENGAQPGGVLPYKTGYTMPRVLDVAEIPSSVLAEERQLINDMEYCAGISQLMAVGNTPTGVESGAAIETLRNIDNTRLSNTAENLRTAIKDLAKMWLEMYKKFACGYRAVCITGRNDVGSVLVWCSDDINNYDIDYTAENELKLSEEQQKQNFLQAYQLGLFTNENGVVEQSVKDKAIEVMKLGTYSSMMGINDDQRKAARRENSFFEHGVMPEIGDFDDHDIHIEEHKRYALQMDFIVMRKRKPELAEALTAHIKMHEQAIQNKQNAAMAQAMALQQGVK